MSIVVCAKPVPDTQSERAFGVAFAAKRATGDGLLCEVDGYAVEGPLRDRRCGRRGAHRADQGSGPGREHLQEMVKNSLQAGAAEEVRVNDGAIADSDAAVTPPVPTGSGSVEGTMGVVAAMLARRLGLPRVTFASELTGFGAAKPAPARYYRKIRLVTCSSKALRSIFTTPNGRRSM